MILAFGPSSCASCGHRAAALARQHAAVSLVASRGGRVPYCGTPSLQMREAPDCPCFAQTPLMIRVEFTDNCRDTPDTPQAFP
jgi:hypothetical protein